MSIVNVRGLCLVGVALAATLAHAKVYKWVDANGQVQYGDQPPAMVKSEQMKLRSPAGVVQVAPPQAAGKGNVIQAGVPTAEEAKVLCANANANLKALGAKEVFTTGPDGKNVKMPEAERQAKIAENTKAQQRLCKGSN